MSWKRWLRRTFVAVVLCLVLRTIWLVGEREWHRASGGREFAAAAAETEVTDPDWQWDALQAARTKPAPGRNSAAVLRTVSDLSPPEWLPRNGGKPWEPDTPALPANVRFPLRIMADLRQTLARAGPAVDLAVTLRDYPEGHTPIDLTPDVLSTKLPHVDTVRHATALLKWEVVLALEDGKAARAVAAAAAMLNTSRSIGDDPFLVCQLVRMATRTAAARSLERVLAQCAVPDPDLTALQSAWAADAEEPLLLYGLRGERATLDVLVLNLINGTDAPRDARESGGALGHFGWWLYRGRLSRDRAYLHRYLTEAVALAKLPAHQQPDRIAALPALPDAELRIAGLFLPAVERCAAASWRSTAEARCVVAGLACERFRSKHDRWPGSLAELSPEFLTATSPDPFTGGPLGYTVLPDGVVIHSAGRHPVAQNTIPRHVGLPDNIDIGFRLWSPEARRQPPPPEPQDAPEAEPKEP